MSTTICNGMLFSRSLQWGRNAETSLGIVFDYDYIRDSFVELSAMAVGFGLNQLYLKRTFCDSKPDVRSLLNTASLYVRFRVR